MTIFNFIQVEDMCAIKKNSLTTNILAPF